MSLLLFLYTAPAKAAEYPVKPINVTIPFPAGGAVDLASRSLMNDVKKHLGQPVICENKAGGGGTVGPSLLLTKAPDGYNIGVLTASPTIAWHMKKINFNPASDVTPIIRLYGFLSGIVVRADSPWKSLLDLIQYAKQNPQKVSYGSPGVGTPTHLGMEELAMIAGIQLVHVPYKGGAEDIPALLGGHVDLLSEASGWAPMVDAAAGIIGPKGLPKAIVQKLHAAFHKAMDDPEFQSTLKKFDMPSLYLSSEGYEEYIRQDSERIRKIIVRLGLDKN
jgi:tripartite-type tricarboxylate transporter receptor subunit TctC